MSLFGQSVTFWSKCHFSVKMPKTDYSSHFDHFCRNWLSFTVKNVTSAGPGQSCQNDTFRPKWHFLPKWHFSTKTPLFDQKWRKVPKWPKSIIRAILSTFAKIQPLSRSRMSLLMGQAKIVKNVKKSKSATFWPFFDFFASNDSLKTTTVDSQPNHHRGLKTPCKLRDSGVIGPEGGRKTSLGQGVRGTPRNGKNHAKTAKSTLKPHRCLKVSKQPLKAAVFSEFWQIYFPDAETWLEAKTSKTVIKSPFLTHFLITFRQNRDPGTGLLKTTKTGRKTACFQPNKTGFSLSRHGPPEN